MSIFKGKVVTSTGGADGEWEIPDADTHYAVLVAVIDLGTHTKTYGGGESNTKRRVAFVWELTEAKRKDGSNHFLAKEYTLSFNKKAALIQDLEAVFRTTFDDGKDLDLDKAIGSKWAIPVTHQTKLKDGKSKTYSKLGAVGPVKKGATVPPPTVTPFAYSIGDGPAPDHPWLPRIFGAKIADSIMVSPEWQALGNTPGGRSHETSELDAAPEGEMGEKEEELPF